MSNPSANGMSRHLERNWFPRLHVLLIQTHFQPPNNEICSHLTVMPCLTSYLANRRRFTQFVKIMPQHRASLRVPSTWLHHEHSVVSAAGGSPKRFENMIVYEHFWNGSIYSNSVASFLMERQRLARPPELDGLSSNPKCSRQDRSKFEEWFQIRTRTRPIH